VKNENFRKCRGLSTYDASNFFCLSIFPHLPAAFPAFILTLLLLPIRCAVTPIPCDVTNWLQNSGWELQHMDGSYSRLDWKLQQTGFVKINPRDAARRCGNIFGPTKS
jgi:hypothetical protein